MNFRMAAAALAALGLSACVSVPPLDFTVSEVTPVAQPLNAKLEAVSVDLAPGVARKAVGADNTLFPLWKESLNSAVNQAKLFDVGAERKAKVVVQVNSVKPPLFGIEMVTQSSAKYDIVDAETGLVLFSQVIESKGSVPGDYAFVGVVRMQESVNRAVRNSISSFIQAAKASGLRIESAENGNR
jgi:outer membrane murein-binding lipoprotein Lpp